MDAVRWCAAGTVDAGLVPAVSMDTGYVNLLSREQRHDVLRHTRDVLGGNRRILAGAFVRDEPGDAVDGDAYRRETDLIHEHEDTPIIFQSYGLTSQPADGIVASYEEIGRRCPEFLAFELGRMFAPFGKIYGIDTFRALLAIPQCTGAKHSSLSCVAECRRLALRDEIRPDFQVLTGNDLAIDMVMYGSDYLLGLSTFAPDVFALRDAYWAAGAPAFYEINELERLARESGVDEWSTDLDAVLDDPQYEIYFDAQVTDVRFDSVSRAIEAGKHVYCEKPTALTTEAAVELHKRAEAKGVKHGVVQDKLWLPGIRKLRKLRDTGFFGRVFSVRGEFGYWVFEGEYAPPQRPAWNYLAQFNSSWAVRLRRDDLLTVQVDGTLGSAVAGLRDCVVQPYASTPRPVWNPDVSQEHSFYGDWLPAADQEKYENAFKSQWELLFEACYLRYSL